MSKEMEVVVMEIPVNDPAKMMDFQKTINEMHDASIERIKNLAKELNITESCAMDVWYLRTRSRHTPEKEAELIRLHRDGTPPNICEF
jgi:lysophospholipase L1-like esterase